VEVEYRGVKSPAVSVPVRPTIPALLTADSSGFGNATALNQDNSYNSAIGALPNTYVVLFGVGGPQTEPPSNDGVITGTPLPQFTGPTKILLDGKQVAASDITYLGPAPSLVAGVWQANVRVPADAKPGSKMQVQVFFGEEGTQPGVTISVR
jgi:uncharacterized protein (TIGR03437 family)